MKDIELIEQYLMKQLDKTSVAEFEERLKNDPPFSEMFNDMQLTIEVLQRKWLKQEISEAGKELFYKKLLITGIIIVVAFLSVFFMAKALKTSEKVSHDNASVETEKTEPVSPVDTTKKQGSGQALPLENEHVNATTFYRNGTGIQSPLSMIMDPGNRNPVLIPNDAQVFTIDNTIDNTIKCSGGTVLEIKANTLVTQSGKGHLKEVKISIIEFSNYFALWQHQVTTCSDGKLLESGGACYIEAGSKGETVMVQDGKSFNVRFPSDHDSSMLTFYGARDSLNEVNWHTDGHSNNETEGLPGNNKINLTLSDTVFYLEPIISDEGYYRKSNSYRFDQLAEGTDLKTVFDTLANIPREDAKKLYFTHNNLLFRFGVNSSGKMHGYDYNFIVPKKQEKQFKRVAQYIVDSKMIDKRDLRFDRAIINVTLKPMFRIEYRDTSYLLDSNLSKLSSAEEKKQVYNVIASNAFGYINCDKFVKEKELADIVISTERRKADVRVFFWDFTAVVNCTYRNENAVFNGAPGNSPILVVALVEINHQQMMYIREAKVGEPVELKDPEPFDIVKLKNRLLNYRLYQ